MGTVFFYTVREALSRLMGLVLVLVSAVAAGAYIYTVEFQRAPDGTLLMSSPAHLWEPAATAALWKFEVLFQQTGGLWFFLGIFATASLLTSYLEKGWAEMLFSKGVTRAQMLLGRYFGALGLFFLAVVALDLPPAAYLWIRAGVSPKPFLVSLALLLLSFAALLAQRDLRLYDVITWKWAQTVVDWVYRILPKIREVEEIGLAFIRTGHLENWWPIWSTALFLVGALGAAYGLLRRKDF